MTVTSDRHRMNVGDIHKFEKNISGWFHQWDRQRNLTTSRFANRSAQQTINPTKSVVNTEMHTRALLDCKVTAPLSKQITKKTAPQSKSRSVITFASKLRNFRCENLSLKAKKLDNNSNSNNGGRKVWNISSKSSFTRLTPFNETDNTKNDATETKTHKQGLERRCSSHSNMYSLLLSLKEDVAPNRQRRFPRTNSLRRFVTLREHRKKCEMGLIKVDVAET
uniref:Uncharacterized protein LOC100175578 n=1 Tax=Phallusia mammillata TaxID=59560 RepID=A0A6F9DFL9_9ASCI|nr:uncharacterized protein LOC100175578 [Phallusia mammillata]